MRRAGVVLALMAMGACADVEKEKPRPLRVSTPEETAAASAQQAAAEKTAAAAADTASNRLFRGALTEADLSKMSTLADKNKTITYAHLKKNADRYKGEVWRFRGKILEISEGKDRTIARVSLDGYGQSVLWVDAPFVTDFVDNNRVEVLGVIVGSHSYTSQAGWNISIPAVAAARITKR